ncbi:hypothetical protein N22_050 [Idiomarinaceae phage 1N2-2]|uniref:hypothetical protein n=1 Tax=Idiomarinaceae phage 1N2-2 TaxID=1536592 RepID=UPI0004F60406|nr:hypothetical protein N22_050 [Idiomarinaceae phage 1N2-2]AIM40752.1 hypothetical protein N22_050 [Idiomarinaceae phage 1N2-2]
MTNRKDKTSSKSAGYVDPEVATDAHDKVMLWLDANMSSVLRKIDPSVNLNSVRKRWELAIKKGHNQYQTIVGYIDMFVNVEIGGYERYLAFEVKSKIISVGEAIRQINQYKTYCPTNIKFYIVCPDDKYKSIFEQQGIGFIKSDEVN